jgi:hypothetical protein
MTQDYDKPAVEYFSKPQDFDKPSPVFFRKQGNQWTPVDLPTHSSSSITDLSPTAQAVLDAYRSSHLSINNLAAALRAAADQVVPDERKECEHFTNEAIRLNRMGVRFSILAIAAELEDSYQPQ